MQSLSLKMTYRLVGCLLLACSLISADRAWSAERRELWQSRDQFVALEPMERGAEGPNQHPAEVAPEMLSALLGAIDVRSEGASGSEALFTQAALEALVPQLQLALRTATAKEDVTFAVIGLHKALFGLAKSPKVTTGRMFRRDGHLNLIVGLVQKDFNEREDRRLAPFIPGSRKQAPSGGGQLLPHGGQDTFTLIRKDWIVFTDAPRPMTINQSVPSTNVIPQQTPVMPSLPVPAETRNPVERMEKLNELKNKGLISEEEYRGKRKQILDGL